MITPTTPGPSPWYLHAPWARININGQHCTWDSYDGPTLSGLSRLIAPSGQTLLFVDLYCYVQPLKNDSLLIWYEVDREQPSPRIVFTLLTVATLQALKDTVFEAEDMKSKKEKIRFRGGDPISF